uniref:Uncharacterized protein n=1 Tax=Anguilla anguilla TaxID=7936 RepID=A0A0E9PSC4_ANGAN
MYSLTIATITIITKDVETRQSLSYQKMSFMTYGI